MSASGIAATNRGRRNANRYGWSSPQRGTGPGRATNVIDLLVAGKIGEKVVQHSVYRCE
jgi:hypothetical protein